MKTNHKSHAKHEVKPVKHEVKADAKPQAPKAEEKKITPLSEREQEKLIKQFGSLTVGDFKKDRKDVLKAVAKNTGRTVDELDAFIK